MKLLYYIPAIGSPNLDKKLNFLKHNINYIIGNHPTIEMELCVNCYSDFEIIENLQLDINTVYIHKKPGVITELWMTNPYNNNISKYDYILFVFDDIKIQNLNIYKMIEIKNKYEICLISPRVINASWPFMSNNINKLILTNFLEVFCLLMSPGDFDKYKSVNTIENKWGFGVDFLFGFHKIKTALCSYFTVIHALPGKDNNKEAIVLMNKHFQKLGFNAPNLNSWKTFNLITQLYSAKIAEIDISNTN